MAAFNNEELQREFDLIEEDLEELDPQIKQVDADIIRLEMTLQKRRFCIPVSVFSYQTRDYYGEDGDFTEENEYVDWGQIDDKWRLLMRVKGAQGCLAVSKHSYGEYDISNIPLTEASLAIKLRASRVLVEFVKEVGSKLRSHKVEESALFGENGMESSTLKWLTMS